MDKIPYSLPLITLFHRLRQAGLPLGIDEYQLLVRALQAGFGLPDRAALARLCKTLWIKTSDEERIFDYHFQQVMDQPGIHEIAPQPSNLLFDQSKRVPKEPLFKRIWSRAKGFLQLLFTKKPHLTSLEFVLSVEDEIQAAKAISQHGSDEDDSYFIQTDEYFPITRRQMKQSWRYLRRPVRLGPPIELDIDTTVNEIGRQGILLKPILVPRRTNRVELLLLIDQGGSMVPFHSLSRRLVETALRGGRLGKAEVYYFHNCPVEYLFHDPAHQEAETIQNIVNHLQDERTGVLIFSDAGAARSSFSEERIKMTEEFLDTLKQQVRYVTWLNPMPRSRWSGTTADEIMHFVPMFDLNRKGLDNAINVLRGRPTSYTHFKVRT